MKTRPLVAIALLALILCPLRADAQGTAAQRIARAALIRAQASVGGDRVIIGFKRDAAAAGGVSTSGVRLVTPANVAIYANRVRTVYGVEVGEQLTIIPAVIAHVSSAA